MNDGFINEKILCDYINTYTYDEYNTNIKNFLIFVFKENLNLEESFIAEKKGGQIKPDYVLSIMD